MAADDRIDGYAAAILELAKAEGELERIGDELFRIARAFESSNELREALTDPRLAAERKKAVVDDLLGGKSSPLAVNLVNFVVGLGRASDLPAIADRLAERAAAARNKVIAEVRSASELDEETIARLAASLSRATGRDVEVKTVVDPSVIGGVVARVGDVVIDGTVNHRLDEIRETLIRR
ncbi:MAG: ATP synthase F1 subunit delta [Actinomycetota bacterium]|jgi:F-type H+-transporting ATPase subunit delta|nr:ATP synthase F1 subunit delta [Actinomycetota bacterium]